MRVLRISDCRESEFAAPEEIAQKVVLEAEQLDGESPIAIEQSVYRIQTRGLMDHAAMPELKLHAPSRQGVYILERIVAYALHNPGKLQEDDIIVFPDEGAFQLGLVGKDHQFLFLWSIPPELIP